LFLSVDAVVEVVTQPQVETVETVDKVQVEVEVVLEHHHLMEVPVVLVVMV
jgi:hypothetical protein